MQITSDIISRAQGCFLGQLAGDSLGSLVEFKSPREIATIYPGGVRKLEDGGIWNTLAGQPTDDSEMALMLARSLVKEAGFDSHKVKESYVYWLNTGPFDFGQTISGSLFGTTNPFSQANGALMRVCPLGIYGVGKDLEKVAVWARNDAAITHIHPVCQDINALFAMALAWAIETGPTPEELFQQIKKWATEQGVDDDILAVIDSAQYEAPADFMTHMGWVMIAFQNALFQLVHCSSLEEAIVETVGRGGDTDTNAAICGALLGAAFGRGQIPTQWEKAVLNCRPDESDRTIHNPRPEVFWPMDTLELVDNLLAL